MSGVPSFSSLPAFLKLGLDMLTKLDGAVEKAKGAKARSAAEAARDAAVKYEARAKEIATAHDSLEEAVARMVAARPAIMERAQRIAAFKQAREEADQ